MRKKTRFAPLAEGLRCSVNTTDYEDWHLRAFHIYAVQTTGTLIAMRDIVAYTEATALRLSAKAIAAMTKNDRLPLDIVQHPELLAEEILE